MKPLPITLIAAFFASGAFGQTFEVASIRPSAPQANEQAVVGVGLRIDGAQVRIAGLALKDYIGIAYRLKTYQITGPDWIGSTRFDLAATLPDGAPTSKVPEMLQALLVERFQLKFHHDKKEFPVYALEVAKTGLKMQANPVDPEAAPADGKMPVNVSGSGSAAGVSIDLGGGASYTFANNKFEAKKLGMVALAGNLERFMDRPIVDLTNLKGTYDFSLDVTEEDYRTMLIRAAVSSGITLPPQALRLLDVGAPISLFDSMKKLGLTLDPRKEPLDLLVIDDARKTPSEN